MWLENQYYKFKKKNLGFTMILWVTGYLRSELIPLVNYFNVNFTFWTLKESFKINLRSKM